MFQSSETRVVFDLIQTWQKEYTQGTLVFPSRTLLKRWENHLLSLFGSLGGVNLTLFAGLIENLTGVRSGERLLWAPDQELIIWGILRNSAHRRTLGIHTHFETGFAREMLRTLREFKGLELLPDDLNEEDLQCPEWFLEFYNTYQKLLADTGWRDPEEAIREALEVVSWSSGIPAPLQNIAFIGFHDAKRLQRHFIKTLDNTVTIQEIAVKNNRYERTDIGIEAIIREKCLSTSFSGGLQGCIGSNREWEIRGMARQIKAYIHEGIAPTEIALVFRSPEKYLPIVHRIFKEFDIPVERQEPLLWKNHPQAKRLLQFLRVWCTQGESNEVLQLLTLHFIGDKGRSVDRLIADRPNNLTSGSLVDWVSWLKESAKKIEPDLGEKILYLANRLMTPTPQSLETWLLFAQEELIGYESASEKNRHLSFESSDVVLQAKQEMDDAFERWLHTARALGYSEIDLSVEDFIRLLEELLLNHECTVPSKTDGVKITNPKEVIGGQFLAILVGGLVEGEFPRNIVSSTPLLKMDYQRLEAKGFPMRLEQDNDQDEWALFGELIHSANSYFFCSRPENDESGRPLIPSAIWRKIEDVHATASWPYYSPANRWDYIPISSQEIRYFQAKTATVKTSLPRVGNQCQTEAERRRNNPSYTGILADRKIIRRLESMFGQTYAFSITALEEYAQCPFVFFCHRILGVTPLERPSLLVSPLENGILYHELLRKFMQNHQGETLAQENYPGYIREIDELFKSLGQAYNDVWEKGPVGHVLKTLQRKTIRQTMEEFIQDEIEWGEKTDGLYRPVYFELSFELKDTVDLQDIPFRIIGKVDRVDQRKDGTRFIVFDYKTGRTPVRREMEEGQDLQLLLYIRALKTEFPEVEPMGGAYYSLKTRERTQGLWRKSFIEESGLRQKGISDTDWDALLDKNLTYIRSYITGIRSGHFSHNSIRCSDYCNYRTVCRHGLTGRISHEFK